MSTTLPELEKQLWSVADQLRANSNLKSSEYSVPVLGLIFLRYAEYRFSQVDEQLKQKDKGKRRRKIGATHYQAEGVLYLPDNARYDYLLNLSEGESIGKAVNEAMKAIEAENAELKDTLPKNYNILDNAILATLLKKFSELKAIEGDGFGKVYEYFLGEFAKAEGQRGGEFFTPTSVVKLIVEIIEPFHGRIFDPACGSGGMFIQSADFVARHRNNGNEISIYGIDKVEGNVRLAKMNLAVHGLFGDIRQANSYYDDEHESVGKFDFVMANPPFNVDGVDKERIKDDPRFPFGMPRTDNANYLWIQLFNSALNDKGRAGFVMANSASDARASELDIRQALIKSKTVDIMIAVGSNFFYTVTLPCTLWFLDKGKSDNRKDTVLFIDARHLYQQVTRAIREFALEQIEFIANIVRLYRDEAVEVSAGSETLLKASFPDEIYQDVPGLCKIATLAEIEAQGWSLNPGRYVGVAAQAVDEFDFKERLGELNEELEKLNVEARELETVIVANVAALLEG